MSYKDNVISINKPIRLIELFAGVGSQAMALRNIGAEFERYKISEWYVHSNASYKSIHHGDNVNDYSMGLSITEVEKALFNMQISVNDRLPITAEELSRRPEEWKRRTYNEFKANRNLGSICRIKGADLEITDTNNYCYIMTYTFPCQDLSLSGNKYGMTKGSGTRSGLLWEVERLLDESQELPQVLLMENVSQIHNRRNISDYEKWIQYLKSKGYSNYWYDMNAKDYGVPQNRNRCFMVSVIGGRTFTFPNPVVQKNKLLDILEPEVDECFFLSEERCRTFRENTNLKLTIKNEIVKAGTVYIGNNDSVNRVYDPVGISPTVGCFEGGNRQTKIIVNEPNKKGFDEALLGDTLNLEQPNSKTRRGRVGHGVAQTINTAPNQVVVVGCEKESSLRIRKLTPKECWRLMSFTDDDYNKAAKVNSKTQLYKQAGNSIVVKCLEAIFRCMNINGVEPWGD